MGTRGEIFTKPIKVKNRTYFFNVKENTRGDVFLQIVESKGADGAGFERHSVVVFEDELQSFLAGLDESLQFIQKNKKSRSKAGFEQLQRDKKIEKLDKNTFSRKPRASSNFTENKASLFKKKKPRKVVRSNPNK